MTQVIETLFGLTVSFPLAIIGILGLIASLAVGIFSGITFLTRGNMTRAILSFVIVAAIVAIIVGLITGLGPLAVPLALVSSFLAFTAHAKIARTEDGNATDSMIVMASGASLVAIAVPVIMLLVSRAV